MTRIAELRAADIEESGRYRVNTQKNRGARFREADRTNLHLPQIKVALQRLIAASDQATVRSRILEFQAPRLRMDKRLEVLTYLRNLAEVQEQTTKQLQAELERWSRERWLGPHPAAIEAAFARGAKKKKAAKAAGRVE